jgi:hypothetical protein
MRRSLNPSRASMHTLRFGNHLPIAAARPATMSAIVDKAGARRDKKAARVSSTFPR